MTDSLDWISRLVGPAAHDGVLAIIILTAVVTIGLATERVLYQLALKLAQREKRAIAVAVVNRAHGPMSFAIPLFAALLVLPSLTFPRAVDTVLLRIVSIATTIATAWAVIAVIQLYTDLAKRRYRIDVMENLRARQAETRIDILSRTFIVIVALVSSALAAMAFPQIRALGTTLLASAGVAGLAIGLAARPLFENLVAGVQIALTQPIRIDDVVIVEGEFGRIESIGATYVSVLLWDKRHMILPLTYFIEKPFQNWTRTGSELIGTVFLWIDYAVSIPMMRAQLAEILAGHVLFDGLTQAVQVTDADANGMQVRILVSARNASDLFDLRADVREKMIGWLTATNAEAFPSTRITSLASLAPQSPNPQRQPTREAGSPEREP